MNLTTPSPVNCFPELEAWPVLMTTDNLSTPVANQEITHITNSQNNNHEARMFTTSTTRRLTLPSCSPPPRGLYGPGMRPWSLKMRKSVSDGMMPDWNTSWPIMWANGYGTDSAYAWRGDRTHGWQGVFSISRQMNGSAWVNITVKYRIWRYMNGAWVKYK